MCFILVFFTKDEFEEGLEIDLGFIHDIVERFGNIEATRNLKADERISGTLRIGGECETVFLTDFN